MLYNKTIVDYRGSGYDVISTREYQYSPRSILVFSGRYHIISTASIVNNCILFNPKSDIHLGLATSVNISFSGRKF